MVIYVMVVFGVVSFLILLLLFDNEVSVICMVVQVVSGIGFFGVGVIMCDGFSVCGLSIVVSIWSIGVIGVLVGSGFILVVCMMIVLIVIVNLFLFVFGWVVDCYILGEVEQECFYQISVFCEVCNEVLVCMQLL